MAKSSIFILNISNFLFISINIISSNAFLYYYNNNENLFSIKPLLETLILLNISIVLPKHLK